MAKGCGACGKMHGYSMLECIQGAAPKPTVETVHARELPAAPVSLPVNAPDGSLTPESGSLTASKGSLTKQQRYRRSHPGWYRTYQREYMRRRRAQ